MDRRALLTAALAAPVVTLPAPAIAALSPGARRLIKMLAPEQRGFSYIGTASEMPSGAEEMVNLGYLTGPERYDGLFGGNAHYHWKTTKKFLNDFSI